MSAKFPAQVPSTGPCESTHLKCNACGHSETWSTTGSCTSEEAVDDLDDDDWEVEEDDGGGESEDEEGGADGGESEDEEGGADERDCEDENTEWLSKNKQIMWSSTHEVAGHYVPSPIPTPGPTLYATARISSPESALDLFFTEAILQRILQMTNLQGRRSVTAWRVLTVEELRAYLGLVILAGVYKSQHESTKSLWKNDTGRPIFSKAMAHGRFCQINRALRFDDRLLRPHRRHLDKLSPISDIWSMWLELLPKMFNLGRDICIDEQLVSFSGRCSFRQYMPSKPAKYGLKIWTLCDVSTAYAWSMQLYTGKPTGGQREKKQAMRVVLDLCSELEGHSLTVDNFFTSFPLAAALKKKKMALTGTVRKNKAELPPRLRDMNGREVFSSLFAFTKDHTLVSYIAKKRKNVLILSTRHREPEVIEMGKKKPVVIEKYMCKGAVRHTRIPPPTYSCRRRAQRWPMCVFHHMLDISCFNAFVLFTTIYPEWNKKKSYKRRLFLEEVGKALIGPEMLRREPLDFAEGLVEESDQQAGPSAKRKQCGLCTKPLRASNVCAKCVSGPQQSAAAAATAETEVLEAAAEEEVGSTCFPSGNKEVVQHYSIPPPPVTTTSVTDATQQIESKDDRSEIPTPEIAEHHAHLKHLADKIPEIDPNVSILVLLGRDIPRVHKVREHFNGPHDAPYAQRLDLGWVIIGNDPTKPIREYRMTVHVFGNSPAPAIAIYGLRRAVQTTEEEYNEKAKQFVLKNFYVNDGLASFPSHINAIQTLKSTKEMLSDSNIRLHKIPTVLL
ncbi:uncharacterized protein LOC144023587 [Festucalex cinctus]